MPTYSGHTVTTQPAPFRRGALLHQATQKVWGFLVANNYYERGGLTMPETNTNAEQPQAAASPAQS